VDLSQLKVNIVLIKKTVALILYPGQILPPFRGPGGKGLFRRNECKPLPIWTDSKPRYLRDSVYRYIAHFLPGCVMCGMKAI
jgi:hypothetical protein